MIPKKTTLALRIGLAFSFGATNPDHPNSSTKPLNIPIATTNKINVNLLFPPIPNSATAGLIPERKIPGQKTGENIERINSVMNTVIGANNRANAYHFRDILHLINRERNV